MQTIQETEQEIINEFSIYDDWMDKYSLIIDAGNTLEKLDEKYKTPENIIEGCQSRVWLNAEYCDNKLFFRAESDAVIVKGLLALVIRALSGHTPAEILGSDLHFIKEIGLTEHLSPTRSNGLLAVIKQMRFYAMAYQAKNRN